VSLVPRGASRASHEAVQEARAGRAAQADGVGGVGAAGAGDLGRRLDGGCGSRRCLAAGRSRCLTLCAHRYDSLAYRTVCRNARCDAQRRTEPIRSRRHSIPTGTPQQHQQQQQKQKQQPTLRQRRSKSEGPTCDGCYGRLTTELLQCEAELSYKDDDASTAAAAGSAGSGLWRLLPGGGGGSSSTASSSSDDSVASVAVACSSCGKPFGSGDARTLCGLCGNAVCRACFKPFVIAVVSGAKKQGARARAGYAAPLRVHGGSRNSPAATGVLHRTELKVCARCNHYHHRWRERDRLRVERQLVPKHPLVEFYSVVQDVRASIAIAYPRYAALMVRIKDPSTITRSAYQVRARRGSVCVR